MIYYGIEYHLDLVQYANWHFNRIILVVLGICKRNCLYLLKNNDNNHMIEYVLKLLFVSDHFLKIIFSAIALK